MYQRGFTSWGPVSGRSTIAVIQVTGSQEQAIETRKSSRRCYTFYGYASCDSVTDLSTCTLSWASSDDDTRSKWLKILIIYLFVNDRMSQSKINDVTQHTETYIIIDWNCNVRYQFYLYIHHQSHVQLTVFLVWVTGGGWGGGGTYPSMNWARDGNTPWTGCQSNTGHLHHSHPHPGAHLDSPNNLTCMSLDCGR